MLKRGREVQARQGAFRPRTLPAPPLDGSSSCWRYLASLALSNPRWYSVAVATEGARSPQVSEGCAGMEACECACEAAETSPTLFARAFASFAPSAPTPFPANLSYPLVSAFLSPLAHATQLPSSSASSSQGAPFLRTLSIRLSLLTPSAAPSTHLCSSASAPSPSQCPESSRGSPSSRQTRAVSRHDKGPARKRENGEVHG